MISRRYLLFLAAVLSAFALGGCGVFSSSDEDPPYWMWWGTTDAQMRQSGAEMTSALINSEGELRRLRMARIDSVTWYARNRFGLWEPAWPNVDVISYSNAMDSATVAARLVQVRSTGAEIHVRDLGNMVTARVLCRSAASEARLPEIVSSVSGLLPEALAVSVSPSMNGRDRIGMPLIRAPFHGEPLIP